MPRLHLVSQDVAVVEDVRGRLGDSRVSSPGSNFTLNRLLHEAESS